ncbi:MAG: acyl-ACP--UDP-N-acetylglucosamine O-acyltransferase [Bacteroidales bacterium]|nr:acyl-ACP--UDP-N-acetylglucosamine O-acyltransferase [Bacteroidales bacterium]MDD6140126.1 acyl-ACP--UDP-N-acetylglucosamine O-acyltransferase [Bacteroidales bacterium]MDD6622243.1 acyl-ACP--UDP-N-acetylglucosamine O-acyltransferase [Bacteroidales bacterium]
MISPLAYVDPSAKLGNNVTVHPFAFVDRDVEIGDNCEIYPYASIMHGARLGNDIKVYNGAIIAAEPQDFRWKGDESYVTIGDKTTIREMVIINRSIHKGQSTEIGEKCFLMAETHIGHDCKIGARCVLGNSSQLAGDVVIDPCTILSTSVKVYNGSRIGKWAFIKGGCRISGNVPPYVIMAHNPAMYYGVNAAVMRTKPELFSEERIDDIAKAYRHIYQCNTSIFNAVKRIEADVEDSAEKTEILTFIKECDNKLIALPRLDTF